MLLGDRGSRARCLFVWVSGSTALGVLAALARPAAGDGWHSLVSPAEVALDRALADLAGAVLLGCTAWAWLALTATVVEGARGLGTVRRRSWLLPVGVRRLVLAACGLALATGPSPALADAHGHGGRRELHGVALLRGLPLPDRVAVTTRRPPAVAETPRRSRVVVVERGDTLWSIAADDLGPGASAGCIVAHWHAVYAANRVVIGRDPDLLEPGQQLRLPRKDPS